MFKKTLIVISVVLALILVALGLFAIFTLGLLGFFATTRSSQDIPDNVTPSISYSKKCVKAGCSSQLCVDEKDGDIMSTCEWKEEYACYGKPYAKCEVQDNGKCGWTESEELISCVKNSK